MTNQFTPSFGQVKRQANQVSDGCGLKAYVRWRGCICGSFPWSDAVKPHLRPRHGVWEIIPHCQCRRSGKLGKVSQMSKSRPKVKSGFTEYPAKFQADNARRTGW